jgi:hypothetical protein
MASRTQQIFVTKWCVKILREFQVLFGEPAETNIASVQPFQPARSMPNGPTIFPRAIITVSPGECTIKQRRELRFRFVAVDLLDHRWITSELVKAWRG